MSYTAFDTHLPNVLVVNVWPVTDSNKATAFIAFGLGFLNVCANERRRRRRRCVVQLCSMI